jgi:tetratricopeptide (TPR) repeat protein
MKGRFWSTERPQAERGSQKGQNVADKAIQSYEEALKIDSSYVLAYAGLADVYASISGNSKKPTDALEKALSAVNDALERKESRASAEVYASIGTVKWWLERDFVAAVMAFERAITINPQLADAHKRYSSCLTAMGKHNEAKTEIKKALELEPNSAINQLSKGINLFFEHDYQAAIEQLEPISKNSQMVAAHRFLAMAYGQASRTEDALEELKKAEGENKDNSDILGARAYILAHSDKISDRKEALNLALILERQWSTSKREEREAYVSPYNIAVSYAAIPGEEKKSIQWIDEAIAEGDPRVTWLNVDPRFDELRKSKKKDEFDSRVKSAATPVRVPCEFNSEKRLK